MLLCLSSLFLLISLSFPSVLALPRDDIPVRVASPIAGKLRIVENSGVCETTPGVYQASGYGALSANQSMWFWFFSARKNPDTAPLALWFGGGPGSSSMTGIFQEDGPCRITNDSSTVVPNPYTWATDVNMMYIDQPLGTGFSYTDKLEVGTSQEAARDVWKFLQIFFEDRRFAKYSKNSLAIWTESYGGHYGPTFAAYFLDQNAALLDGKINGTRLNLSVLGIGNGLTDPLSQYPGYVAYAAENPYRPTVNASTIAVANDSLTKPDGCLSLISKCYDNGSDEQCSTAQTSCNVDILVPLAGDRNLYDIRYNMSEFLVYPPDITTYLNSVASRIGAEVTWKADNRDVQLQFVQTGDWSRNSRLDLERVINAGVRTLIFDGDADYVLNYKGVEALVDNIQSKYTEEYKKQIWTPYKVAGQVTGQYKTAGSFAYLRVYGAGHKAPAYTFGTLGYGQAAQQFFNQTMFGNQLTST